MSPKNLSRRSFMQWMAAGAALVATPWFVQAQERRRGSAPKASSELDLPMAVPGKDAAAALNYVEKHADVKKAELKVEKAGVAFDKQNCSNCIFYKSVGQKGGKDVGTCQVLPGKLVVGGGWCSSWAKK